MAPTLDVLVLLFLEDFNFVHQFRIDFLNTCTGIDFLNTFSAVQRTTKMVGFPPK